MKTPVSVFLVTICLKYSIPISRPSRKAALGYEVVFAENGEQAVEQYFDAVRSNKPFGAVILDLTIRGSMGGEETIKRLTELDPGVVAILSSGYTENPVVSNYMDEGFKAGLSKPYEIEELSNMLNRILTVEK